MNYAPHLALLLALITSPPVRADEHLSGTNHGRIDLIHLTAEVPGRGACVQMKPSIPGRSSWACLWRDHPLYAELHDLIVGAFTTGKRCTLYWDGVDARGHKTIDVLECWRT